MVDHPTPEELIIFETLRNPVACAEIFFNDFDNLSSFSEKDYGDVRLYQYPFLSFDSQYLNDEKLSKRENFNNKKGMAEGYILGGRGTGKTLFSLVVDCLIATFHNTYKWGILESCDDDHVKTVMEKIVTALEFHPILRLLETYKNTQRKPYRVVSNNGCLLESVNDNLYGKDPGKHWFGKHCDRVWSEESSFITKEVTDNKLRAVSELGVVERFSGMTTFSKVSPMGEIFDNLENINKIVNTPSCVNPSWGEEEDRKAQLQFGGINSVGFQVQILGKVIENDEAVFNMDEVRKTYIKDNPIKAFEINKNNFFRFKEILILERPINAEKMVMALDVGEGGAPTEIIVLSQTNKVYKYIYNITVFKLSSEEHYELLEYLMNLINVNSVGVDVTSIDKEEYVLVKIDKKIYYDKIYRLEKLIKESKDVKVPTYNKGILEWKKATLEKHNFKGLMHEFTTLEGNKTVKVTDCHSMMIYTPNGLIEKKASDCNVGDWVISPKKFNIKFSKNLKLTYKALKINQFSKQEYKEIELNEELAYFLGWCVAEGSSKTTGYQLSVGDSIDEAKKLLKIYHKLFKSNSGYILTVSPEQRNKRKIFIDRREVIAKKKCYTLVLGGGLGLLEFLSKLCGTGSHNKKIPNDIFNSPLKIQKAFLKGYFEGDGSIRNRYNIIEQSFGTVSEDLAKGIITLLQMNSIDCYLYYDKKRKCYKGSYTEHKKEGHWNGIPLELIGCPYWGKKKLYNSKYLRKLRINKVADKLDVMKKIDWKFSKIRKIIKSDYDDVVYDFVVEDNHTFVAGCGNILVHNSGGGKAIISHLSLKYSEHLIPVSFNENIDIDFEKDAKGNIVTDAQGKYQFKHDRVDSWSIQCLKRIFYNGKIKCLTDMKMDTQFGGIIAKTSSQGKTLYGCKTVNHLFQSFQVFAIMDFLTEFKNIQPIPKREPVLGVFTNI